ncbi:hypothetical protein V7147_03800, partial [Bacillus sp. JJ1521]|uniref:hypothetical protein n=1 Tax=Bacillus sp. JJ1521 TaxID=3122957 RepID=UPI002FFE990D
SYDTFTNEAELQIMNAETIEKIERTISNHIYEETSNSSNAIGKCHEAISYYYFLKEFPLVSQVDYNECVKLLSKYYSLVKPEVLEKLFESTSTLVPAISEKLYEKYDYSLSIESIELIPESYISDKLDTGDLQLVLKYNGEYFIEKISLKALSKIGSKITTKNPGIGTILGEDYFNVGSIDDYVKEVKSKYLIGEITHRESLELVSEIIGEQLLNASHNQLKQGIMNLLGTALMAVTFYNDQLTICREHTAINSTISILRNTPTNIQNTLVWNDETEKINLRVKFSRGQNHGWSSIKLTSEYQLN